LLPQPQRDLLLDRHLTDLLGPLDPAALDLLHRHLQWQTLSSGDTLLCQGEPGDSMYLVISGRLRAYVAGDDGTERLVREMSRGQVVGELSLYTGEPRSATVVATRDCVLVKLGQAPFRELVALSPQISMAVTRQIIHRMQNPLPASAPELARPVTVGLLAVTAGVDVAGFAAALAGQLAGRVICVDAAHIEQALGLHASDPADDPATARLAHYLEEVEATHDLVLLIADKHADAWTRCCTRRSDELLLLADATEPPVLHDLEREILMRRNGRAEAAETLVLLHAADLRCPSGTRAWLDRRPVAGHLHIRPTLQRDMARLARIVSRRAVGLVFAGGGARGLAHLGVVRALQEHGVHIDVLGGTSIGSVMAALVACDQPLDQVMAVAQRAFGINPTGDFNLLPFMSLLRGKRLRQVVQGAITELCGEQVEIEDLWKTSYVVTSNYSQSCEMVLTRGPLLQALLASTAIPGALPPVLHRGDLLCDGGTFNNFPVDVMRGQRGISQVIGVDLSAQRPRPVTLDTLPSPLALLIDRLRPRRRRRYRLPGLMTYLMNVTILYSRSRQAQSRQLTDLYFNPPLHRVGLLQWKKFDSIVAQGYRHAVEVLGALPMQALTRLRAPKQLPMVGDR
jgi:NTE family protein